MQQDKCNLGLVQLVEKNHQGLRLFLYSYFATSVCKIGWDMKDLSWANSLLEQNWSVLVKDEEAIADVGHA